jgi:L-alanine-DL-glutamate epimerase-like enolase superfamily enzyme
MDDVVTGEFEFREGMLRSLDGPGLGVEVDVEKVHHYAVSHRETSATGVILG